MNTPALTDTKPYLIRALHEWCTDNGLTPHVAVRVDPSVRVPAEYVKDGEIVLNVSYDATSSLQIGNDFLEFKARFGGVPREILVPIGRVLAVYARENGQGMAFGDPADSVGVHLQEPPPNASDSEAVEAAAAESRPHGLAAVSEAPRAVEGEAPGSGGDSPVPPTGGGSRPALKRIK